MIPYGHQSIGQADIDEVVKILQSDWITQGSKSEEFERALAKYCGSNFAVVASSGTAALHAAYFAAGLGTGDEIITSAMTFVATANAALWQGAKPVFVDVEPATGNIDANLIEEKITGKTKAIVPIDYTGRPADLAKIQTIARKHQLLVIEDACQALGGAYRGKKIGNISDMTTFSFHPVKSITTGEGGAVLTNNREFYKKMKMFVTHGVTRQDLTDNTQGAWYWEMQALGLNYRMTDFQCALGISQLKKLNSFISKRRQLVRRYQAQLAGIENLQLPPSDSNMVKSAWHLYVVNLKGPMANRRKEIFGRLREAGVGVSVHHIPVHTQPYYRKHGFAHASLPVTERFYKTCLSLPLYPNLTKKDQDFVIEQLVKILA